MKSYKPLSLILIVISCAACSYGQVWKQYTDSGKVFQEQNKIDKAIEFYSKAREELKKDSVGTISYAISCNDLAGAYRRTEQYVKAAPLYLEVKQIRESILGNENAEYAASCNNLGIVYQGMNFYTNAEIFYTEAKSVWKKLLGKQSEKYALSCSNLANLYTITGRYEQAEPLYLEALEIREKVFTTEDLYYAKLCNRLASLYDDMGQFEKAELLFLKSKQIREKLRGKCSIEYTTSCSCLACLYNDMGQFEKAESLFLEALHIEVELSGKENLDYIISCGNLATLYSEMSQIKKAELLYLELQQLLEKLSRKRSIEYATLCNNLAILYQRMGRYRNAEMLLFEAREISEKVLGNKENSKYAVFCTNLANVYVNMKQYAKARLLYIQAKQIQKKVLTEFHPDYRISCENLAILYRITNQPLEAEKEFKEVFSINAYNLYAIFQFTNEKEKASYVKNILGEDEDAYSFFVTEKVKSGHPYTLSLFHRNLILYSSQALKKQLFSSNDTSLINAYNDWLSLKSQLSVLYAKPVDEGKENIVKIEDKAGLLEKKLTLLSSAFAKQQQQLNWKDIQSNLKADEASIEFASFHFTNGRRLTDTIIYAAFVLRKDSLLPNTVILFKEKQLQNLLSSARYKISQAGVQRLYTSEGKVVNNKAAKKTIYELVWKPLEIELTGIKTIYFSPSGLLHRIAFAALPVNKKEVLSDRYKLVQLATTSSVADQQRSYITDSDKIQLYGGIYYHVDTTALKDVALTYHHEKTISRLLPVDLTRNGELIELPGTKKEIEGIVSLSGNYLANITSRSGINATEESLKSLDGKASPAILHIATHGFFFPDPKQDHKNGKNDERGHVFKLSDDPLMRSGLLFAGANNAWQNKPVEGIDDGILTGYEVSNLYLPNTKLVVLSACETGLGDIQGSEGVYGLQRAFKMAGAQNLVMSLWKVSDLETAEFMEVFYKNMFAQQSISDAFYNAQNVMKNKYRLEPYKWAAWILVR